MTPAARLGLGIVGLGLAGAAMLSAALSHERVRVVAVADPMADELPLEGLDGVATYRSLEALLEDPAVEAVHLATPTLLHAAQVHLAVDAGRHVVVEKPVTADSEEVGPLAAAAGGAGVAVVVGHSESFEPYVAALASATTSGRLGSIVAVTAEKVTDWMRRPRRLDELDPRSGGGIIRRQGVHQVDVVRSLLPGATFSVRGVRLHDDRSLQATAGYVAWLEADDTSLLLLQDGTGVRTSRSEPARPRGSAGPVAAEGEKRRRAADLIERALGGGTPLSLGGGDAERLAVLGTEGRAVGSSGGVLVERAGNAEEVDLRRLPAGRTAVLDELVGVLEGGPARHDLSWGGENLRLCEEIERAGTR